MGGILRKESRHMLIEAQLALPNYADDLSQTSLPENQVIRHIVMQSVTKVIIPYSPNKICIPIDSISKSFIVFM